MIDKVRRVVIYARVSSDTQKEKETVRSQLEQVQATLARDASVVIVGVYVDEAFSGPTPLEERPEGSRLMADARRGFFDEAWFFKLDRLGRDEIDPHLVRRQLDELGIKLHSLHENIESPLEFGLRVLFAAEERRTFLIRTASGMDRAARDGRYCGGIVPLGYRVEGVKPRARLVPDDTPIWGDWSGTDLVRHIYRRLAVDGWPCARVARELNDLGVPTAYRRDGRGVRGKQTQGLWYAGRIRNLIVQPVYKGVLTYGRRSSSRDREVITAQVPPLVSEDVWNAAQQTLAANRIIPKNTRRLYLLRGLIWCTVCGKRYIGTGGPRYYRYVCNGRHTDRRPPGEKGCFNVNVRGPWFDEIVWADIERALRNPGDVIDDLVTEQSLSTAAAVAEAERTTLSVALQNLGARRQRALGLHSRGATTDAEFDTLAEEIAAERAGIESRLRAIEELRQVDEMPADAVELLREIVRRLDEGRDDATRREVAALLIRRISVHPPEGDAPARILIEYRFPGVVSTSRGTDSGQNYTMARRVVTL